MAKKPTNKNPVARSAAPEVYLIANTAIKPEQLYELPARKPRFDGPWRREVGKIAWTDDATGLGCIILRGRDGALSGYVAIPPAHPLAGFEADAIASSLGLGVHGGLTYARACDEHGPEEVRVCHARTEDGHLWWLGFSCSLPSDFVPTRDHVHEERDNTKTYRTEGYVFEECTLLASQLASLTDKSAADDDAGVSIAGLSSLLPSETKRGGK